MAGLVLGAVRTETDPMADFTQQAITELKAVGAAAMPVQPVPVAPTGAAVWYNETTKKYFVPNFGEFAADDDASVLQSATAIASGAATGPLVAPGAGWQKMDTESFLGYAGTISDPGLGKLAAKNFGIGVDQLQLLGGYGTQLLGDVTGIEGLKQTGQGIVAQQIEDLRKNEPYQRQFTDIGTNPQNGVLDWFVANLAQQGPNMIESVVTAAIGATLGGAAGGGPNPFTAAGGALAALTGKQAFKQGVLAAAKKYTAGEALDAAETKLLFEAAGIDAAARAAIARNAGVSFVDAAGKATVPKSLAELAAEATTGAAAKVTAGGVRQGRVGGAALLSGGINYGMGASDIYGETVEAGQPNAAAALLGGIPYTLLDTVPEYLAAARFFGELAPAARKLSDIDSVRGKALEMLKRVSVGGTVGAATEGGAELGQEALLVAANPTLDLNSPEAINRFINAFAAGAAIGGPVSAFANLSDKQPTNLLNPAQAPTPNAPLEGDILGPEGTGGLPGPYTGGGGTTIEGQFTEQYGLPSPPPTALPTQPSPQLLTQTRALPPAENFIPPTEAQPQGELNLGGGTQYAPRQPVMTPSVIQVPPERPAPVQGALQPQKTAAEMDAAFASNQPAMAPPLTAPVNAMSEPLARLKRGMEFGQAQQQAAAAPIPSQIDYTNALVDQPVTLDTEGATVGKNVLANNGRRQIIAGFNQLTKAQQDAVLNEFDNDIQQFFSYVSKTPAEVARKNLARLAKTDVAAFKVKVPAPTAQQEATQPITPAPVTNPKRGKNAAGMSDQMRQALRTLGWTDDIISRMKPADAEAVVRNNIRAEDVAVSAAAAKAADEATAAAENLKKGKTNAAQDGKNQQSNQQQRTDAGGRLAKGRQDRNIAPQEQEGGDQAGRGNQPQQGGAQSQAVSPAEKLRNRRATAVAANEALANRPNPIQVKNLTTLGYSPAAIDAMPRADMERILRQKIPAPQAAVTKVVEAFKEGESALANPLLKKFYTSGKITTDTFKAAVDSFANPKATPKQQAAEFRWFVIQASDKTSQDNAPSNRLLTEVVDDAIKNDRQDVLAIVNEVLSEFPDATAEERAVITPLMNKTGMTARLAKQQPTPKELRQTKKAKDAVAEDTEVLKELDKPTTKGAFIRADGTPITQPMSIGRVKMAVAKFASKLTFKPKLHVYRNLVDLKSQNPSLFNRAAAARPEGDFATTEAIGYSFGDDVIIFSDYVKTDEQLAFVLAHEVVGHYGLRALMTPKEMATLVDSLNRNKSIRHNVDQMMSLYGIDRVEATEEFIANNAAMLDVSIWRKLSYLLKNVLNRLGIKFHDDALRPIVSQARNYIRNGHPATFVSMYNIGKNLKDMQEWASRGVFMSHPMDDAELAERIFANRDMARLEGTPQEIAAAVRRGEYKFAGRMTTAGLKDMGSRFLRELQTMTNKANKNMGLSKFMLLVDMQTDRIKTLNSNYKLLMQYSTNSNWLNRADYPKPQDREIANDLLGYATLAKLNSVPEAELNKLTDNRNLVRMLPDGTVEPNEELIDKLFKKGLFTPEEFTRGIKYTDSLGNERTFQQAVTADSPSYKIYLEMRTAMRQGFVDALMAKYIALQQQRTSFSKRMQAYGFDDTQVATLQKIADKYRELYFNRKETEDGLLKLDPDAQKKADEFVYEATRVMYNDKKLDDWLNAGEKTDEATKQFLTPEYADIISGLSGLARTRIQKVERLGQLQAAIKNATFLEANTANAEFIAKRNLAEGWVRLRREGKFQMRTEAYDARTGQQVVLSSEFSGMMPYMRNDNAAILDEIASDLDKALAGEWKVKDREGNDVTVVFRTSRSDGQQFAEVGDAGDYADFAFLLNRFNIDMAPAKRKQIITALTDANDPRRGSLERQGNPGWDRNLVKSVNEYLKMNAAAAAKDEYRYAIEDTIADDDLWEGSYDVLTKMKAAYEAETNPHAKAHKQRLYEDYAFKYIESHKVVSGPEGEVTIGTKKFKTKGGADTFRGEARSLLQYMADNRDLIDGTGAFFSTRFGSDLKTMAVVFQLGMSVATSAANLTSLPTHAWSYLAFRNPYRSYGLGHGEGKAAAALFKAVKNIAHPRFHDLQFLQSMVAKKEYAKYGLSEDDAQFLLAQTASGVLSVSMSDAMLGAAEGNTLGSKKQDVIDAWMYTFSYTERLNRRAVALAAYRLERDRNAAFMTPKEARDAAFIAAEQATKASQGNYDATNRPSASRGNFTSLLFMYKMFSIITVEMLRNLPVRGQLAFLGMMFLMAGLKGIPGEEDLTDILTTLSSVTPWKTADVEMEIAKFFDAVIPGSSKIIMRGPLDYAFGITISSRVGQPDIIPLSGVLNYGADPWREAKDFGGPVLGATLGAFSWAGLGIKKLTEVAGFSPDTTNWNQLLRESPVAMLRNIGDAISYADNGAIVNTRGQVISKDVGTGTLLMRLAGFTPSAATAQNDITRYARATDFYAKDVATGFKNKYLRAKLSGDAAALEDVRRDVIEWNRATRGTALEIKNFEQKAMRAYREAQRSALSRYRRTTADPIKQEVDMLSVMFGIDLEEGAQQ